MSLSDLQEQNGHAILTIKKHKTAHVYGPVILAIPPTYKKQFDEYLVIRSEFEDMPPDELFLELATQLQI